MPYISHYLPCIISYIKLSCCQWPRFYVVGRPLSWLHCKPYGWATCLQETRRLRAYSMLCDSVSSRLRVVLAHWPLSRRQSRRVHFGALEGGSTAVARCAPVREVTLQQLCDPMEVHCTVCSQNFVVVQGFSNYFNLLLRKELLLQVLYLGIGVSVPAIHDQWQPRGGTDTASGVSSNLSVAAMEPPVPWWTLVPWFCVHK